MTNQIMLMRLMGCKFGIKKTERDYKLQPDDPQPIHEVTYEVTIRGPSGTSFKMAVSDSAMCETGVEPTTRVEGDDQFESAERLVREIVEMFEDGDFKAEELLDPPAPTPPVPQYVFVIDTGDPVAYPPCGLRVSVNDGIPELLDDLVEFFLNAEGREGPVAAHLLDVQKSGNLNGLKAIITLLATTRRWTIYSPNEGYDVIP